MSFIPSGDHPLIEYTMHQYWKRRVLDHIMNSSDGLSTSQINKACCNDGNVHTSVHVIDVSPWFINFILDALHEYRHERVIHFTLESDPDDHVHQIGIWRLTHP